MAPVAQVIPADADAILPWLKVCEPDLRQGDQLPEVIAGSRCFLLRVDGRDVFAWAVSRVGDELWIDAAAGKAPGYDLTAAGLAIVEAQAAGLETVGFLTRRPGLLKKAQRLGYQVDGWILRKRIK